MKSYTDIEQSKLLSQILPIESADMYWWSSGKRYYIEAMDDGDFNEKEGHVRAWSLAALLSVLPKEIEFDGQHYAPCLFSVQDKWLLKLWYNSNYIITSPIAIFSDNPIDACYEMILKLHELNLL